MRNFIQDESGATSIEYAMIASMTTVVLAGVLSGLQGGLHDLFQLVTVLTRGAVSS